MMCLQNGSLDSDRLDDGKLVHKPVTLFQIGQNRLGLIFSDQRIDPGPQVPAMGTGNMEVEVKPDGLDSLPLPESLMSWVFTGFSPVIKTLDEFRENCKKNL